MLMKNYYCLFLCKDQNNDQAKHFLPDHSIAINNYRRRFKGNHVS